MEIQTVPILKIGKIRRQKRIDPTRKTKSHIQITRFYEQSLMCEYSLYSIGDHAC